MKYNVIINENYNFPLFFWDGNQFRMNGQLDLATDDFLAVKQAMENITSLSIIDSNGLMISSFRDYDTCTSINYIGHNYSPQREEFCDEIIINLKNTTLEQQVKQLNTQIDGLNEQIGQLQVQVEQLSHLGEPLSDVGESDINYSQDQPIHVDESVEENVDSGDTNEDATAALNEEPDLDSDIEEPNDDEETEILEDAEQIESEYDEPTE